MSWIWWVLIALIIVLFVLTLIIVPVTTWFITIVSGAHVPITRLVGMKLRKIDYKNIVESYIQAKKAGLSIDIVDLETHSMAGGNVTEVVASLISAHSAKIPLTVERAKAIDLAGRDLSAAIKMSVTPRVLETPPISAVAKDGIELIVKARVTVRANIEKLVRGAGEGTVLARIGEGIVTTVGSAKTYTMVLENPDLISKTVLAKGLDDGTAFEILSIDIADIDVGQNVGSKLMTDQAEADRLIAQARAEERRAMALALEQEMRAKTQEMRALVLAAEAEVPKAMSAAIRNGNIGAMDYYRLQNLMSDTNMRNSIAGTGSGSTDPKGSKGSDNK